MVLARVGSAYFAIGANCTHYGGPLAEGVLDGHTVRCPWHHACFSLRTGEALRAPAIDPVTSWKVEQRGERIFVTGKIEAPPIRKLNSSQAPSRIVIVGGGAAGFAAAEQLRRDGYEGSLVMLSDDVDPPVDRPICRRTIWPVSRRKSGCRCVHRAGYRDNAIELRLKTKASKIDPRAREVELADGTRMRFDRLLLATGAEPVRLDIPGGDLAHVHVLRTLTDCRAIIAAAERARRVVVIGASFIGLETAAALRTRNLDVHVAAPEKRPLERVFGAELSDFVRSLHEEKGVGFHLEMQFGLIEPNKVTLKSGQTLDADLVIMGVGVRPRTQLAEQAGLKLDRGVLVNEYLQTSAADVFAARGISRDGPTATAAKASASNTGWSPSGKARRLPAPCSAAAIVTTACHSSGANTTMSRSIMSAMPAIGTLSTSKATFTLAIAWFDIERRKNPRRSLDPSRR